MQVGRFRRAPCSERRTCVFSHAAMSRPFARYVLVVAAWSMHAGCRWDVSGVVWFCFVWRISRIILCGNKAEDMSESMSGIFVFYHCRSVTGRPSIDPFPAAGRSSQGGRWWLSSIYRRGHKRKYVYSARPQTISRSSGCCGSSCRGFAPT